MDSSSPDRPPLPTRGHALFLDFDGTLVELAEHPDRVLVPPVLLTLLQGLERTLDGALAIVTGRRLESLDARLAPLCLRGAGLHGAQLRPNPRARVIEAPALTGLVTQLQARYAGDKAIWIEDKGAAVAVHYRQAPERREEVREALTVAIAAAITRDHQDIEIVAGKCVFEARSRGYGKDRAIRELLLHEPFQRRLPIFIGDDRTDEDGMLAAQVAGGYGVKVGTGDSAAKWRLANPSAVLAWLKEANQALTDKV